MKNDNRRNWRLGRPALAVLALSLAGCGGTEPVAPAPPPLPATAPQPVPVAFIPQAVEVALGTSGEVLILMAAENGGYTLNGEAFASGTDVTAESNGSRYTLSWDGTTWSAAYIAPDAISLALGTSGGSISIERLEDGSYQANDRVVANGSVVAAQNGSLYTIVIGEDGSFTAKYVVPSAQSVPLGSSGSAVALVRNEDGSFSLEETGEIITASTRVTAGNGNVYAAVFSPEGVPVGVMHVPATQEVMLGELGGTVTLKQLEDMTWWAGEMEVRDGSVQTAANGNSYTLSYANGVWSARFEPEEIVIEGTGLTAMTREAGEMYDVGNATLPANGVGDITVDGAMYHVWMTEGGMLAGVRFGKGIDPETDLTTNGLPAPYLSPDDPDTVENEANAQLVLPGDDRADASIFSMTELLGSGISRAEGKRITDIAVEEISAARSDVSTVLSLDIASSSLDGILDQQWAKVKAALDKVFGTNSAATAGNATFAVRSSTPWRAKILDEIDEILASLASEDAFVAATAEGGQGVFAQQRAGVLGADAARDTFNRVTWSAEVTMGMAASTRYGTAVRKANLDAKTGLTNTVFGAFSYATMQKSTRTVDAASPTGIASYSGGTEAISKDGTTYSGTMDLQVRFRANSVIGVVKDLMDSNGVRWQHNFADVDRIVLGDARLRRNAQWNKASTADAQVFFTADSGVLRPINGLTNTFRGVLLGRDADAGSEASGVWSVNDGYSNYLTGGFGVTHIADVARPRRHGDDGSNSNAAVIATANASSASGSLVDSVSISDGILSLELRQHGWRILPGESDPSYGPISRDYSARRGTAAYTKAEFDLADLAERPAPRGFWIEGPKHVEIVIEALRAQREQLETLQRLGDRSGTIAAEAAVWETVRNLVQYNLFGGDLPIKLAGDYTTDIHLRDDALGLIDRVLTALLSDVRLLVALDPNGTGIFNHWHNDSNGDGRVVERELEAFIRYDANDRRWVTTGRNRTLQEFLDEPERRVLASLGLTDYTRFGIWRWESSESAERQPRNVRRDLGGPGAFAYSMLHPTQAGTETNPAFPTGGSASYFGETVALMGTDILTGTAKVDVSWATRGGTGTGGVLDLEIDDRASNAGRLSLTISDLADTNGDPLTYVGNVAGVATPSNGFEIADIVLAGLPIEVGLAGSDSGHLIVGAEGTANGRGEYDYGEISPAGGVRYRLRSGRIGDQTGSGATIKALLVGQGPDGPLGVIGTWTLRDTNVARVNASGAGLNDRGSRIQGSFGTEIP